MMLKPLTSVCLPLKGKVKRIDADALEFVSFGAVVETVLIWKRNFWGKTKIHNVFFGNIKKKRYIWSAVYFITI